MRSGDIIAMLHAFMFVFVLVFVFILLRFEGAGIVVEGRGGVVIVFSLAVVLLIPSSTLSLLSF
jgi:hypothetical protein